MVGLLRAWYKGKKLRHTTYTQTYAQLEQKFADDIGEFTLVEFIQYHYMSQQIVQMAQLAATSVPAAEKKDKEAQPEEPKPGGQYL